MEQRVPNIALKTQTRLYYGNTMCQPLCQKLTLMLIIVCNLFISWMQSDKTIRVSNVRNFYFYESGTFDTSLYVYVTNYFDYLTGTNILKNVYRHVAMVLI